MKSKYVVAGCCLAFVSIPAKAADTQIHVEYAAVYDRLRPDPLQNIHLRQYLDVTLSGENTVSETSTRASGTLADQQTASTTLGQRNSDGGSVNWTVLGPDKLQRVVEGPQSVMTMTIAVTGTSCTLEVEFKLKRGFTEFKTKQMRNGQMGFFSRP